MWSIKKPDFAHTKQQALAYEKIAIATLKVFFDAHTFVRDNQFRKYLLVSGIGFLLLFSITIKALLTGIDAAKEPLTNFALPYVQKIINLNAEDIKKGIQSAFWLVKFAIESNKDAIFSGIFLIIGTPFFSFISSKTEEIVTGQTYPFQWPIFWKEIRRGISLSFRNALKQMGLIVIITLIGFIPLVNIITPLLIFLVQAYYNGILMTDYSLERHGYSVKQSEVFYKKHIPEMFGIGLGFMFLLLIPVVGWFIAPTYALVASYLQFSRIEKL